LDTLYIKFLLKNNRKKENPLKMVKALLEECATSDVAHSID